MANAPPPPRLDAGRTKARNLLLVNLLVLPGLGSILARRKAGWLQALLALAGFALTLMWFITFIVTWVKLAEFPADGGPHFAMGLLGLGLYGVAWVWALITSLGLIRQARS